MPASPKGEHGRYVCNRCHDSAKDSVPLSSFAFKLADFKPCSIYGINASSKAFGSWYSVHCPHITWRVIDPLTDGCCMSSSFKARVKESSLAEASKTNRFLGKAISSMIFRILSVYVTDQIFKGYSLFFLALLSSYIFTAIIQCLVEPAKPASTLKPMRR